MQNIIKCNITRCEFNKYNKLCITSFNVTINYGVRNKLSLTNTTNSQVINVQHNTQDCTTEQYLSATYCTTPELQHATNSAVDPDPHLRENYKNYF